jgi:hypothetical protein
MKKHNWTLHNRSEDGLLTFLKTRKDGSVIALIDRNGVLVPETKLIVREGSKIARELLGEDKSEFNVPDGVQFRVETIEELEQAYEALNDRWDNDTAIGKEKEFFSVHGFRWVCCEKGKFFLYPNPESNLKTIPNPFKQ